MPIQSAARTPQVLRLASLGAPGSFSEEAARAWGAREGQALEAVGVADFEGVLAALVRREVDLAILPVVNTVGGLVRAAFEAMGRHRFEPVGQIQRAIRHSLLVSHADIDLGDLTHVASHPQALAQCGRFLLRELPRREWLDWSDTASAARDLAAGRLDPTVGVLASARAAELYGLHVLRREVQTDPQNATTFVVLRRADP